MCNPISWWYVRSNGVGKLLISDKTDSHSEAALEFGINDTGVGEVCAGEFRPDAAKPSPDLSTWILVWDYLGRSRRPDWMDNEGEALLRAALERECKKYVYTTAEHEVASCRAFAFGDARLIVRGTCSVEAWGSSSVEAWGSSRVVARDNSSVEAWGSSSVVAWGNSRVVAGESSSVVAWGNSSVEAWGSSRVEAWGNSRVVARGSSRVVAWESSSVVAWGNSSVVAGSRYADVVGRGDYDGNGHPILRMTIDVGKTYAIKDGALVAVTTGASP